MDIKICAILLGVLLITVQKGHGRTNNIDLSSGLWEYSSSGSTIQRFMKLTTALQLGDTCSWKAEELRLGLTHSAITTDIFSIWKWMHKISKNNEPICNANKLTVCSQNLRKCICGEPYLLISQTSGRQKYVVEDGVCRWDEGSACVMEDFAEQIQARSGIKFELNSKCKEGTTCRTHGSNLTCSSDNLVREIRQAGLVTTDAAVITEAIYSGNICSCQAVHVDPISHSLEDSESSEEYESLNDLDSHNYYGRSKRDTSKIDLLSLFPPYVNL